MNEKELSEKIKNDLSIDQVKDLLYSLGGNPIVKGEMIMAQTICHGGHSHKLYYYDNTKLFRCYTNCGDAFDIFDLVLKVKEVEGVKLVLPQAVNFIIDFYDISDGTKKLAQYFMTVLSVTVIGTSYQMPSLTGIIRAGGETDFVFYNDLIFMWGLVLPSSFAAAFLLKLSPVIVFICLKSDQLLKCFVAVFKVNRFNWIKDI
jgi:uncharacterized protein YxjI